MPVLFLRMLVRQLAKLLSMPILLQFNPIALHLESHILPLSKLQISLKYHCKHHITAAELAETGIGLCRATKGSSHTFSPAVPQHPSSCHNSLTQS